MRCGGGGGDKRMGSFPGDLRSGICSGSFAFQLPDIEVSGSVYIAGIHIYIYIFIYKFILCI